MNRTAVIFVLLTLMAFAPSLTAQTTTFNYQGRLTDAGNPANGTFQIQFKLFDSLAAGGQVGSTINDVPVTVSQGTFAVKLDFGSNALSGANRWLEIAVRHNSGESYVTLSPREQIASAPYAVQTLNAQMLGGIPASDYVTNATVGSSFIRNGATLQTGSFNISGDGFFGNRVGIGTTTPLHRLAVGGGPAWTTHAWAGSLDLGNASAIGWRANAGGTRFGMGHTTDGFFMFRTASELGNTVNQAIYDLKIDNNGNIGIGSLALNTDVSQARLNIFNVGLGYGIVNTLGAVSVGSYVDAIAGRYGTRSNHPLQFFTNNNPGSPQMTLSTNGNVGIGVINPTAKLSVSATTTSAGDNTAYFEALNIGPHASAIHYGATGDWLIRSANSTGKVILQDGGGNVGIGTATPNAKLQVVGNVTQSIDSYGLPKAMLYVSQFGSTTRCYNGTTGSSTPTCGFGVTLVAGGVFLINFGFPVANRFALVTPDSFNAGGGPEHTDITYSYEHPNVIRVRTYAGSSLATGPFTIIVY